MVPELAGNPFLPQLFALWDHDKDDKLTQEEFNAAIDTFLRAQTPEEKMQCAFTAPASSQVSKTCFIYTIIYSTSRHAIRAHNCSALSLLSFALCPSQFSGLRAVAFRIFDSGGKGRIGEKDLTLILAKSSGAQMSESDLQTVWSKATSYHLAAHACWPSDSTYAMLS